MGIDQDPTLSALNKFNTFKPSSSKDEKVLRVVDSGGRKYLQFVDKSEMSVMDRIKTLFGLSDFNLKNVLSVVSAKSNDITSLDSGKILLDATIKLTENVSSHYKKEVPTKLQDAIERTRELTLKNILKFLPTKVESISDIRQALLEEAKGQSITQGPFRGDGSTPAFKKIITMLSDVLKSSGLINEITKKIQGNASAEDILDTIIAQLEKLNDPQVKQMGDLLRDACSTIIEQADKDNVPMKNRHIKDAERFTVGIFILRPMAQLIMSLPKEQISSGIQSQKTINTAANEYTKDSASSWAPKFNKLAAVLMTKT